MDIGDKCNSLNFIITIHLNFITLNMPFYLISENQSLDLLVHCVQKLCTYETLKYYNQVEDYLKNTKYVSIKRIS